MIKLLEICRVFDLESCLDNPPYLYDDVRLLLPEHDDDVDVFWHTVHDDVHVFHPSRRPACFPNAPSEHGHLKPHNNIKRLRLKKPAGYFLN